MPTKPAEVARRDLAPGAQLRLDAGVGAWRVEHGAVEVFATPAQTAPGLDARRFVCSAGKGEIVFSSASDGEGLSLVAFPVGEASLSRLPLADLGPDVVDLAAWIEALARVVAHALSSASIASHLLVSGDEDVVHLAPGQTARSAHGVVWRRVDAGAGRLFGAPDATVEPGDWFPLSQAGWVEAGPDGLALAAAHDSGRIEPASVVDALERFQQWSLEALGRGLSARAADEAGRIALSTEQSSQAFGQTFARFSGLLGSGGAATSYAADGDALQGACALVVRSLGRPMPAHTPSDAGATLSVQERIVRLTRMPAREVALYGEWWRQELGPMVGFEADTGAPLALLPSKGGYDVVDPASGTVLQAGAEEAALRPSGYALYPPLPEHPLGLLHLLKFAGHGSGKDIGTLVAAAAAGAVLSLAAPVASGMLIDVFIPDHLKTQLLALGAGLFVVTLVQFVLKLASDLAQLRLFARGGARLQAAVMDRCLKLPGHIVNKLSSVDLAQRAMVVDGVRRALSLAVVDALLAALSVLANLMLLFLYAPVAGMTALGLGCFYLIVLLVFNQVSSKRASTSAASARQAQLANQFVENIAHLRVAAAEERAFARWGEAYAELQGAVLRGGQFGAGFSAFIAVFEVLALAVFFALVTWLKPAHATTGDLVILIAAFGAFIPSTMEFGRGLRQVLSLEPFYRRSDVLLKARLESNVSQQDPGLISGRIQVSNVVFSYDADSPPVLNGVSLTIEPGQFVAFVGASGCGKSTLLRLLLGFEAPQSGAIFFDGQDIKRVDVQALRRQIGVVMQNGRLMPGSIAENILGVNNDSTEAAWDAARRAGLAEDIEAMPMGMHTPITDGESTLSGGQVQRLLIARALASHPRVLFMDEATSALDNRTQAIVTDRLGQMAVTRIVVAHRLSTIQRADRIFVFSKGKIVQEGGFEELWAQPGLFAELAKRQMH